MRAAVIIIILSLLSISDCFSQATTNQEPADTIFLLSTRKLLAQIKSVSSSSVGYVDLKSGSKKTLDRKQIEKIIYGNGRLEVFNKPVFSMVAEGNWKTVVITDKNDDVVGMHEITDIFSRSSQNARDFKTAKRGAENKLKKLAAKYGGMIVLVTETENIGGYGDVPTYSMKGIVYGYEPPSEEIKKKIAVDKEAQRLKDMKEQLAKEKAEAKKEKAKDKKQQKKEKEKAKKAKEKAKKKALKEKKKLQKEKAKARKKAKKKKKK